MANTIPSLKKKLSSFASDENGKISKESLVKAGAALLALGGMASANSSHSQNITHGDASTLTYSGSTITATHVHYDPPHSNHSSHGSHGSMSDSA